MASKTPALRREGMQAVRAEGLDVNIIGVGFANGRGTIVGLENGVTPVVVIDRKNARVGGVISVAPIVRIGRVA